MGSSFSRSFDLSSSSPNIALALLLPESRYKIFSSPSSFPDLSFVFFTVSSTGIQKKGKYINAEFGHIGGLKVGDDVVIAGIKVGEVSSNKLDRQSFLAIVELNLEESISIPDDSIAKISSASLLGGQYVEIIPGASDIMLKDEETIYNTRDPVSITDLLGQAVFSATN